MTMTTTPNLNKLSGPDLVKVYNAITGLSVERFTNKSAGLNRIRGAMIEASMTEAQAFKAAGMEMPDDDTPTEAAAAEPVQAEPVKRGALATAPKGKAPKAPAKPKAEKPAKAPKADKVISSQERRRAGSPKAKAAAAAKAKAGADKGAPREGSKTEKLIGMLSRRQGATVQEIMDEFGWLAHTTRAAMSKGGLGKRGITVTSEKDETRGRVYRIAA